LHTGHLPTISLIGEVEGDGSNEERAWIVYGRAEGWRLVNQTDGGEGASGRVVSIKEHQARSMTAKKHLCSKESRLKSNRTRTGQKRSIDARLKMSKARAGKKPWIMGKHHSIKSCLKMSERRKGIVPWNKGLKEKK